MDQKAHVIQFTEGRLSSARRPEFELSRTMPAPSPVASSELPSRLQENFIQSQLELFEAIHVAAAIVNRDERIVRLNRRCEHVLGSSLSRQGDRFVAQDRGSHDRLRKALQAVFSDHSTSQRDAVQGVITGDSEPPILFRALPLGRSSWDGRLLFALLVFCSPQLQSTPDMTLLSRAFGLTPAQARIASHLATGASLDIVAARLGISKETARNHLKQIFLKVGTRRQGELIVLLSSFWLGAQQ